jgi:tripartite-type tricarboxylate transporter receptor subunit TctC
MLISRRTAMSMAAATAALPFSARASDYPNRPIKIIVPYPPGDGPDVITRALGELLYPRLKQSFVIENQPGAGTTLAAANLKRAEPDGYTLMFGGSTGLAVAPALYNNLRYDPVKDFTLVCTVAKSPFALFVPKNGPKNLAELVARAKAEPDWFTYGSAGSGSPHHLLGSMLVRATGIKGTHVPYKGVSPALNDLVAGRIQASFSHIAAALGLLQNGDLRAIAVAPPEGIPALANVPSFADLGYQGFQDAAWLGLVAPAGLPPEIAERISRETVDVVKSPEGRKRIESLFLTPDPRGYSELKNYVAAEVERWGPIVKASGAEVN